MDEVPEEVRARGGRGMRGGETESCSEASRGLDMSPHGCFFLYHGSQGLRRGGRWEKSQVPQPFLGSTRFFSLMGLGSGASSATVQLAASGGSFRCSEPRAPHHSSGHNRGFLRRLL